MDISILKWIGFTLFVIAILLIIVGGYNFIIAHEAKQLEKAKKRIIIGGSLIFSVALLFLLHQGLGLYVAPIQHAKISLKETMLIEHNSSRSPDYFVCELIDSQGRTFESESRKHKTDAKNLCETFIAGQSYDLDFKVFDGHYYIVENNKD